MFLDALENTQIRLPGQTYVNALIAWTSPQKRRTATLAAKTLLDRRSPQSLTFVPGGGVPVRHSAAYADPRAVFFTCATRSRRRGRRRRQRFGIRIAGVPLRRNRPGDGNWTRAFISAGS